MEDDELTLGRSKTGPQKRPTRTSGWNEEKADRFDDDEYHEACERIIEKLGRLREREQAPVQTKCAGDRLTLIKLALRAGLDGPPQAIA